MARADAVGRSQGSQGWDRYPGPTAGSGEGRRPWAVVLVCCLAILGASYVLRPTAVGYDGRQYLTFAENLLRTNAYTYDGINPGCGRAPGYPVFLALLLEVAGSLTVLFPLQLVLLWLAYLAVARTFARELPVRWTAGLLLALTALWPIHRLALHVLAEPLFMAMTGWALLLVVRHAERGGIARLVGAAVLLALSAYVRPVNVLAGTGLAVFLWLCRCLSLRRAALLAALSLAVIVPWTVRNYVQFQRVIPMAAHYGTMYYMTDGSVFWPALSRSAGHALTLPIHKEIAQGESEITLAVNERFRDRALDNIRRDPLGFGVRCLFKTVFIWSYLPGTKDHLQGQWWIFAGGVAAQLTFLFLAWRGWRLLRGRSPALAATIAGYALYTTVVLFPFNAESRYLLPVYIWLFGLAWYWVLGPSGLWDRRVRPRLAKPPRSSDWEP